MLLDFFMMGIIDLELLDVNWLLSFERNYVHQSVRASKVELVLTDGLMMA